MKLKRVTALVLAGAMVFSLAACGDNSTGDTQSSSSGEFETKQYADIVLGEDYTDLNVEISLFNHRTDMDSEDYGGVTWAEYIEAFNEVYPNITIDLTTDTNYADDAPQTGKAARA